MPFDQRRDNRGPRGSNQPRSQPRPQGNQREVDGNRRPQQGGGHRRRRRSQGGRQQRSAPPPPPSYLQRDLLLIPNQESLVKIQAVRTQFDPLALKVPPHITLMEPEPRTNLQNDYLKKLNFDTLPKLNELRFEKIVIHEEVFLWMIPSPESAERLRLWRDAVIQGLPQPGQADEEFLPHISLGYLTRDL